MTVQVDPAIVRDRVQARLGVRLLSGIEQIDGGIFPVLRPFDLEVGHGFCIALSRTPRQVTTSLHLDSYAGRLLRLMQEADASSRRALIFAADAVRSCGSSVVLEIDNVAPEVAFTSSQAWRSVSIEVSRRLTGKVTEGVIQDEMVEAASSCLALSLSLVSLEEIEEAPTDETGLPEGAKVRVEVNRYERSPVNRAICIAHFGPVCQGCGFKFVDFYGAIAEGYIEVHHLTPVSQMGEDYVVSPLTDLVPLCANCHAVVHRRNPPLSLAELQVLIESQRARRRPIP